MANETRRDFLANTVAAFAATVVTVEFSAIAGAQEMTPVTHNVVIKKFEFIPAALKVKPGDVIVWTNIDVVPHTATAKDQSWSTGTLKKGQSESLVVSSDMALGYYCRFHPAMNAKLELTIE